MAYNPRTAIRRFGLTPEEDAMRTPVSLPLAGPLPAGLADDITDATVRGVRADQRAASTDAATSALTGQPPIIDLGDESEFIIPREEPSNLFGLADDGTRTADYRPGRDGPILPATVLPNYVPGQPRGDTVLLSNVQPSPSGAPASRNLSSLPVTPMSRWRTAAGHYNLEPMVRGRASRSIARLPGGVIASPTSPSQSMDLGSPTMTRPARSTNPYTLPRLGLEFATTTPESRLVDFAGLADDDPDSVWTPQSYADGLTRVDPTTDADVDTNPDDDVIGGDIEAESENATDIDADADLEVSEPLDPRRRAKLFGPAPQTTEYEDAAIRRGRELDQRAARGQRIAAGVAGGLGLLGLLTGSDVATGLGQAAASAGGAIPTDVEEQMRARAEQRRVREQGGIDRENALVDADNEAMRQDASDQMRMQSAASDEALNQARIAQLQQEDEFAALDRQLASADNEAARQMYRSYVAGLNDESEMAQHARAFAEDPSFNNASAEMIREHIARLNQLAGSRHSGMIARGGGGGGRAGQQVMTPDGHVVWQPGTSGQRREPAPAPGGTPSPGTPAPSVRPRSRPTPAPAPVPAPSEPVDPNTDRLAAIREFMPNLSPDEMSIARDFARSQQLTSEQMRSAAGQQAILNAVRSFQGATRESRTQMLTAAASRSASEARGEDATSLPPNFNRADYISAARSPEVRDATLGFYDIRALRARLAGASDAQVRSALHGGSEMSRVAGASALRAQIKAYMNAYFHEHGGAVITPEEAQRYSSAFASDSIAIDPDQFRNAITRYRNSSLDRIRRQFDSVSGGLPYMQYYYESVLTPPQHRGRRSGGSR